MLLNTTAPGASSASFAAPQTYLTGAQAPTSVGSADINGDGLPDLLVSNAGSNSVTVLLSALRSVSLGNGFAVGTIRAAGSTAPAFSFDPVFRAPLNTLETSNTIVASGLSAGSTGTRIGVSGGQYSVNGAAYTSIPGHLKNGDTVSVQLISSSSFDTRVGAKLSIGATAARFYVTTRKADTRPYNFHFRPVTKAPPGQATASNEITVGGLEPGYTATPISITGGQYSLNNQPYTSAPATVKNGDTVSVLITSSTISGASVTATLTVGGYSGSFVVTTR